MQYVEKLRIFPLKNETFVQTNVPVQAAKQVYSELVVVVPKNNLETEPTEVTENAEKVTISILMWKR